MGIQWALSRVFVPDDVPLCHCYQQEWAWLCYLPRQVGTLSGMGHGSRAPTNCNGAHPPDSSRKDVTEIYHNVYQLQWLLWRASWDEETEVHLYQDILDSIKECLWCRQPSTLPGAEPSHSLANVPRLDPQAEFNAQNHANVEWFMGIKWDSCEEALAVARDTHWQALTAATLLEEKIKRLSLSLSHGCTGSCQCSRSHNHSSSQRRSCTVECQARGPSATPCHGISTKRQAPSPHPSPLDGGWPFKGRIPVSKSPTCQLGEMKGCKATSPIDPARGGSPQVSAHL